MIFDLPLLKWWGLELGRAMGVDLETEAERTERTTIEAAKLVDEQECPDCGHDWWMHHPHEGCLFERGDSHEAGYAPMALGPCGCRAVRS